MTNYSLSLIALGAVISISFLQCNAPATTEAQVASQLSAPVLVIPSESKKDTGDTYKPETPTNEPKATTTETLKVTPAKKPAATTTGTPKATANGKPATIANTPKVATPKKLATATDDNPKVTTPDKPTTTPKVTTPQKLATATDDNPKVTTPDKPATTSNPPKVTTSEKPIATTSNNPKVTTPDKPAATTTDTLKATANAKPEATTTETTTALTSADFSLKSVSATINGTSTLHDWESKVTIIEGKGLFQLKDNVLASIKDVEIKISVQGIKSKEGNKMDNKTYEAFQSDKYPYIIYSFSNAAVKINDSQVVTIATTGDLSMAGTSKSVSLLANGKELPNGDLQLAVSKTIKMTDYNMKPPVMFLGTIRVGDEITVNFDFILSQKK